MTAHRAETLLAGRYRRGGLLGRGGMAEVYDAFDERLHRPVAVKVLRPEMAAQPGVRTRFEAEARSAARLAHPNVVAIYDTGEEGDTPFIVMERLPGETLGDRIANRPVEPAWLLRVAGDVLLALGAAHAAGIVHRDVKPGNILLAADGCAKVADFGIAKSLEMATATDLTGTNQLVGTPAYLAPERLNGQPATPQSDLYAVGVVLYEALAGQKPFAGPTPVAMAYAITHEAPRSLSELRPDLPAGLVSAIERALAKDPAERFNSAADMAGALRGPGGAVANAVVAAEPTVAAPLGDSTEVLPASGAGGPGPGPPSGVAGAGGRSLLPAGLLTGRRRVVAAVVVGSLLLLSLFVLVAASRTAGPGERVAADLREVADELGTADGPASAEAEARLRSLADAVERGSGAPEANAFLTQLAAWRDANQLTAAAVERMRMVVSRVPGVDPNAFSPPTTAPPVTEPPPPPEAEERDEDDDERKGKGKGRKGKGDDD